MQIGMTDRCVISSKNLISEKILRVVRVFLAVLVLYSIVMRSIYSWNSEIPPLFYFTVQTNLACALFWFFGSLFPRIKTPALSFFITTYAALTGFIFILLLDYGFVETLYTMLGAGEISDTVHYYSMTVSTVTHYLVPALMVLDFLVFTDSRGMKANRLLVLVYPACYFVFANIFAAATGKYIYPFFDPEYVGGYANVMMISVAILVIILLLSKLLVWMNKKMQGKIERYYSKILETER